MLLARIGRESEHRPGIVRSPLPHHEIATHRRDRRMRVGGLTAVAAALAILATGAALGGAFGGRRDRELTPDSTEFVTLPVKPARRSPPPPAPATPKRAPSSSVSARSVGAKPRAAADSLTRPRALRRSTAAATEPASAPPRAALPAATPAPVARPVPVAPPTPRVDSAAPPPVRRDTATPRAAADSATPRRDSPPRAAPAAVRPDSARRP